MGFRRVLPSAALPLHAASGTGGGQRLRERALEATVSRPLLERARVGGADILLTRLPSGEVVAFQESCPHQGVSLTTASVFEGYVRCAQHHYLYDPRTGRNVLPSDESSPAALERLKPGHLTTFPVSERDGWIWVSDEPNPAPAPPTGAVRDAPPARRPPNAFRRPDPASSDNAPLEHAAEERTVAVDGDLELELITVVRPGHLWQVEISGPQLAVEGQVFRPGPPCTCTVQLAAVEPGDATVRCAYALPWSDRPREVRTFVVRVTEPADGKGQSRT